MVLVDDESKQEKVILHLLTLAYYLLVYRIGCKGPTLHYRGKGHQGYKLSLVSGMDKS